MDLTKISIGLQKLNIIIQGSNNISVEEKKEAYEITLLLHSEISMLHRDKNNLCDELHRMANKLSNNH
jgi:hypothetical protein